jgi:hypothetical protein
VLSGIATICRGAPVGQEQVTSLALHPGVVLGHSGQVLVRTGEVRLGVCLYPGVSQGRAESGLDGCGQGRAVFTEPPEDAPSH